MAKKIIEHHHVHVSKRRYSSPKIEVRKKTYSSPVMTYSHSNKYDLSQGFDKPKNTWSFAGWGAVGTLILACFLFVAFNAKLLDKPYLGLEYWLKVLENVPQIDIAKLYTTIKPVDLPSWLVISEALINFIINIINLFIGSVSVLVNVLETIRYFISNFVLFVAG